MSGDAPWALEERLLSSYNAGFMRQLFRNFVLWGKKYDLPLTLLGSVIVFGTYLCKDIYLDNYKDRITEMNELRDRYENRKLLIHVSQDVESISSKVEILANPNGSDLKEPKPDIPEELAFLRPELKANHTLTKDEVELLKRDLDIERVYSEIHYLTWSSAESTEGCTLKDEDDFDTKLWQIRNSIRTQMPYNSNELGKIEKKLKHCEYKALGIVYNDKRIAEDYLLLNKAALFLLFVFGWVLTIIGKLSKSESSKEQEEESEG